MYTSPCTVGAFIVRYLVMPSMEGLVTGDEQNEVDSSPDYIISLKKNKTDK